MKSGYNQDVKSWVRNKPMNWCRILSIISGKLKIGEGNLSATRHVSVAELKKKRRVIYQMPLNAIAFAGKI